MSVSVDIMLPGLFDVPLDEIDSSFLENNLPHLNRLLRFARPVPEASSSLETMVAQVVGFPASTGLPMAQAFAQAEGKHSERCLLFQPIHLKADLNKVLILPSALESDELDILINDLSVYFKVDCHISAVSDGVYFMHLQEIDAPLYYPHILSVLGKAANPYIEQNREILPWYKLINEIQMFLHQHEINRNREARDMPTANSLWFWGGGKRPGATDRLLNWYGDNAIFNTFVESLGLSARPIDELDLSNPDGRSAILDLSLLEALKLGRGESLQQLLLYIDDKILGPVDKSLRGFGDRLVLRAGLDFGFEMRRHDRLKWWRAARRLADLSGRS